MMNYANLFWIWGHPEVYILILPAFGVFSEVVSTFSRKRLFGYDIAGLCDGGDRASCPSPYGCTISSPWASSANVNAFFGITTMIIAVPTGVKVFNWLLTMYRGRITLPSVDAVDAGLHRHLRHRRHDGRAAGRAAGRLPDAQHDLPGRALPQHDHPGRAVRLFRRLSCTGSPRPSASGSTSRGAPRPSGSGSSASISPSCRSMCSGFMGMPRRMEHYDDPALAALPACRRTGRRAHPASASPAWSFSSSSAFAVGPRCDVRRSLGRPHAGMVDLLAAAALQFRGLPARPRPRRLLGDEKAWRYPRQARAAARHRDTGQFVRRRRPWRTVVRVRIRHGLAHLVARRRFRPCNVGAGSDADL